MKAALFLAWAISISFLVVGSSLFYLHGFNPISFILIFGSIAIEGLNKKEQGTW